jgi:hypothetical protein
MSVRDLKNFFSISLLKQCFYFLKSHSFLCIFVLINSLSFFHFILPLNWIKFVFDLAILSTIYFLILRRLNKSSITHFLLNRPFQNKVLFYIFQTIILLIILSLGVLSALWFVKDLSTFVYNFAHIYSIIVIAQSFYYIDNKLEKLFFVLSLVPFNFFQSNNANWHNFLGDVITIVVCYFMLYKSNYKL